MTTPLPSPTPLFPAPPEVLQARRAAMRELIRGVRLARRAGRRRVPSDLIARLGETFLQPVSIVIDWNGMADDEPLIQIRSGHQRTVVGAQLTRREREVAELIAHGLTNAEIAGRLRISLATVKDHVHHILSRTGLKNRTAVAAAVRQPASR